MLRDLILYIFLNDIFFIYADKMARRLNLNPNLSDVIGNLAADRNGLDSVAALLDIRAPSNNNVLDQSSSRPRMAGPASVEDEVRSLFR